MTERKPPGPPPGTYSNPPGTYSNPPIWTPTPDPTILTTAALQREVAGIRELFDTRLREYEKAIALLQAQADKVPSIAVIEERVFSLTKVMDEKFERVEGQFVAWNTRQAEISRKDELALKEALVAAKDMVSLQQTTSATAIAKSEASTAAQIAQIVSTFSETTKALTDKMDATNKTLTDKIDAAIDGLKEKIASLERGGVGLVQRSEGRHETWGSIGVTIGVVGTAVVAMIAVVAFLMKS